MKHPLEIAIVAMGGIFPGASRLCDFWKIIRDGRSMSRDVPEGRWILPVEDAYAPRPVKPDRVYSTRGCFLEPFTGDDLALLGEYGLSDELMGGLDPLFHLALVTGIRTWRDLKGKEPDRARTGIILGNIALPTEKASALSWEILGRTLEEKLLGSSNPLHFERIHRANAYVNGLPAGLLAGALGLGGGCYTIDAACASSLYAVKFAIDELLAGRADAMLCGGVSRPDCLYTQMGFSQLGALSPDGICSPFDEKSNGLVIGEAPGMAILMRIEDALRSGNQVLGVIKGIGLSNDRQGNILAPSTEGQLRAMEAAYNQAGWTPSSVELVECHATGTSIGDSVEFRSLEKMWRNNPWKEGSCVIGSVKSNIGHLLTAAGAAGLLKVLLAMQHRTLPPTAHFTTPAMTIEGSPFAVLREARPWNKNSRELPRRAAVSAFGFGGINAHLLVEEWDETLNRKKKNGHGKSAPFSRRGPVAVTGLALRIGPLKEAGAFSRYFLDGKDELPPGEKKEHWGVPSSAWYNGVADGKPLLQGGLAIDRLSLEIGKFKIPPREMEEMLPQQLVMLQVAAEAMEESRFSDDEALRTGAFIGIGFDFNTTNFHVRWRVATMAEKWARLMGLDLSESQREEWARLLRDAAGPPLNANRTMGALGSVVASRIAREFNLGGPSFTVSSEETSGIQALECAVRSLEKGEIDCALAGAVDMTGDIRALIAAGETRKESLPFYEGAVALVLRRLDDALERGDQVYGVIRGESMTTGGEPGTFSSDSKAITAAMERAYERSGISPDSVGYIELSGNSRDCEEKAVESFYGKGKPETPPAIGFIKTLTGYGGALEGMTSLARALLCLRERMLPPGRYREFGENHFYIPREGQYWLRNKRSSLPRRAAVNSLSLNGKAAHMLLEAYPAPGAARIRSPLFQEGLFLVKGSEIDELRSNLASLGALAEKKTGMTAHDLAALWHRERRENRELTISFVVKETSQLRLLIGHAMSSLDHDGGKSLQEKAFHLAHRIDPDSLHFSPHPLARHKGIAFVFPGSGNHYPGMGRELCAAFPSVLDNLEKEFQNTRRQILPEFFWNLPALEPSALDHRDLMVGQVALGTVISDLLKAFNVIPKASIGYSLGEMAGIFACRAWRDRELMLKRMYGTSLFTVDLAPPYRAARKFWNIPDGEELEWSLGVIDMDESEVRRALEGRERVYLLIVNTRSDCVIGGVKSAVEKLVVDLGCTFFPVSGVTTVHCEVVKPVAGEYHDFHLFRTTAPAGIRFYSTSWGRAYDLAREKAAEAITAQALETVNYPRVIEAAYNDGFGIFIEAGPGTSCSRMISSIVGEKPHIARSACAQGVSGTGGLLGLLGHIASEGVPVNLELLYGKGAGTVEVRRREAGESSRFVEVAVGRQEFVIPRLPDALAGGKPSVGAAGETPPPAMKHPGERGWVPDPPPPLPLSAIMEKTAGEGHERGIETILTRYGSTQEATLKAHQQYLAFTRTISDTMAQLISWQMSLAGGLEQSTPLTTDELLLVRGESTPAAFSSASPAPVNPGEPGGSPGRPASPRSLDRTMCMEFATGSIAKVLGPSFSEVDSHPTRVRLPDEPLMLVDRIMLIEGEPRSLTSGRVVTEHDIHEGAWYLDGNRIPTCIAVEAGQADLFLSGYLGIDFKTGGLAVYRLLDAVVTFHRALPGPGSVIHYDIRIERFFTQGETYLFRFSFESTVDGEPLLSMKEGCAGFFTPRELDEGKGIIHTELDRRRMPGRLPEGWQTPLPMGVEGYSDSQLELLRRGDLAGCFGPLFGGLKMRSRPLTIPGGQMRLVNRVTHLDPAGGRYGLGQITAEADIHPDDWFLTCHFSDDNVMPGTLMYECCMHTLRIFLLRMGWIAEEGKAAWEPLPGVASSLKCRGQVIDRTRKAAYEISIKELGYRPEPFAIADALMYADGKPVVEIINMSIRLSGTTGKEIEQLLQPLVKGTLPGTRGEPKAAIVDNRRILAFATGKPSEAFGEPYAVFDRKRVIARLPGPPYKFLDRIVRLNAEPWKMVPGGIIEAQYDVPPGEWYFASDRHGLMPFSVLLEVALQPCGWLAAFAGSALTSDVDLSFRNLGGSAVCYEPVTPGMGLLETEVKLTNVSSSGGMIIQHYSFSIYSHGRPVYEGTTYFGYFSKAALANQVGIREARLYEPPGEEKSRCAGEPFPAEAPFPDAMLRMIDRVELYVADGGPHGLGYVKGTMNVRDDSWFFKAHFYQDPVIPGSLGLESFIQLMKYCAWKRWGDSVPADAMYRAMVPGYRHEWVYRGQVIPGDTLVTVEGWITSIDDRHYFLRADGYLSVDGRIIYEMKDFTLNVSNKPV